MIIGDNFYITGLPVSIKKILPKDKFHWFEKEVDRSSARGGNNSASKGATTKGVEILITNYIP